MLLSHEGVAAEAIFTRARNSFTRHKLATADKNKECSPGH
jgi:hypothetical protein